MTLEYDDDGYPTEDSLDQIRAYSGSLLAFFREIKNLWWGGNDGISETIGKDALGGRIIRVRLHTWGWSGNESIIEAMESNLMMQMIAWVESRRGGHYIYEFRRKDVI